MNNRIELIKKRFAVINDKEKFSYNEAVCV